MSASYARRLRVAGSSQCQASAQASAGTPPGGGRHSSNGTAATSTSGKRAASTRAIRRSGSTQVIGAPRASSVRVATPVPAPISTSAAGVPPWYARIASTRSGG
nr:hypothetical protein [Micromonospora viridifaciens]